jgi:hypothetical protein
MAKAIGIQKIMLILNMIAKIATIIKSVTDIIPIILFCFWTFSGLYVTLGILVFSYIIPLLLVKKNF